MGNLPISFLLIVTQSKFYNYKHDKANTLFIYIIKKQILTTTGSEKNT